LRQLLADVVASIAVESPFTHILVPLDFTPKNAAALDIARQLAAPAGARVTLLHVIETIEHATGREIEEFYRGLESRAGKELREAERPLAAQGILVSTEIVYGRRGAEIVRYARERGVDLVVMSSHVIDPKGPGGGWATLSYQVATFCPCPVLLVK
jgi:nucleotide-binding universal stress UspA family protein